MLCRLAAAAPPDRRPTIQQLAVRGFRGVSPQLVRVLAQLAGVAPHAEPAHLSPQQWAALWEAWQGWLARLAGGSFAATACPASGAYSLLGVQPEPVPALLPFLSAYYSAEQRADAFAALKQQLVKAVAGAIARLQVWWMRARLGGPEGLGWCIPRVVRRACELVGQPHVWCDVKLACQRNASLLHLPACNPTRCRTAEKGGVAAKAGR